MSKLIFVSMTDTGHPTLSSGEMEKNLDDGEGVFDTVKKSVFSVFKQTF